LYVLRAAAIQLELLKGHLYFARMTAREKILIVGFGDVGQRLAALLRGRLDPRFDADFEIYALLRPHAGTNDDWLTRLRAIREIGVTPIAGDLAHRKSLSRFAALASNAFAIFHFAPPPGRGPIDTHTRNLLASLGKNGQNRRAAMLPQRLIYISTTGVYGNCHGERIDETRALNPQTDRARRRVDAEAQLREWGVRTGAAVSILRAPGIYAADRLPIERLRAGTPALAAAEDVFTNHIHADDLARAAWYAARYARPNRVYNIVDDSDSLMGDYFDEVADHFHLPRPPRVSRAEAPKHISAPMLSFMGESRRIGNARLKRELGLTLKYATVTDFLASLPGNLSAPD
jgi:nucleoside-diphosphate-sugar epimerase